MGVGNPPSLEGQEMALWTRIGWVLLKSEKLDYTALRRVVVQAFEVSRLPADLDVGYAIFFCDEKDAHAKVTSRSSRPRQEFLGRRTWQARLRLWIGSGNRQRHLIFILNNEHLLLIYQF